MLMTWSIWFLSGLTVALNLQAYAGNDFLATGDMNDDCKVELRDFAELAYDWLTEDGEGEWNPNCNLYDTDLIIDTSDLKILGLHWLECTKPECD